MIPLEKLLAVVVSDSSYEFVLKVPSEHDYHLSSKNRKHFLAALSRQYLIHVKHDLMWQFVA